MTKVLETQTYIVSKTIKEKKFYDICIKHDAISNGNVILLDHSMFLNVLKDFEELKLTDPSFKNYIVDLEESSPGTCKLSLIEDTSTKFMYFGHMYSLTDELKEQLIKKYKVRTIIINYNSLIEPKYIDFLPNYDDNLDKVILYLGYYRNYNDKPEIINNCIFIPDGNLAAFLNETYNLGENTLGKNATIEVLINDKKYYIDHYKSKISSIQSNIDNLKVSLNIEIDRRSTYNNALSYLLDNDCVDKGTKIIDELNNNGQIQDWGFANNSLRIITKELTAVDPETNIEHLLGSFEITIPTNYTKDIIILNKVRRIENMNAPHVDNNGIACFGNIEAIVLELRKMMDFGGLTAILISFLRSVNIDDMSGKYIKNWPEVK